MERIYLYQWLILRLENTVVTSFITRIRTIYRLKWTSVIKPISHCLGNCLQKTNLMIKEHIQDADDRKIDNGESQKQF